MNGLDFIRAVIRLVDSAVRYMPPLIMLTGHSDLKHINAARDLGVTEFLCKPVTAKAILTRLNAVIMEAPAVHELVRPISARTVAASGRRPITDRCAARVTSSAAERRAGRSPRPPRRAQGRRQLECAGETST